MRKRGKDGHSKERGGLESQRRKRECGKIALTAEPRVPVDKCRQCRLIFTQIFVGKEGSSHSDGIPGVLRI